MGVGAAMITPGTLSTITATLAEDRRSHGVAVWSGFAAAGAIIGLLAAGALLETWGWSSIFFVTAAIAALAGVAALMCAPNTKDHVRIARRSLPAPGSDIAIAVTSPPEQTGGSQPLLLLGAETAQVRRDEVVKAADAHRDGVRAHAAQFFGDDHAVAKIVDSAAAVRLGYGWAEQPDTTGCLVELPIDAPGGGPTVQVRDDFTFDELSHHRPDGTAVVVAEGAPKLGVSGCGSFANGCRHVDATGRGPAHHACGRARPAAALVDGHLGEKAGGERDADRVGNNSHQPEHQVRSALNVQVDLPSLGNGHRPHRVHAVVSVATTLAHLDGRAGVMSLERLGQDDSIEGLEGDCVRTTQSADELSNGRRPPSRDQGIRGRDHRNRCSPGPHRRRGRCSSAGAEG
jgi:hypothetical protein